MWLKNSRFKNVGPAVTPDGPTGNHNCSLTFYPKILLDMEHVNQQEGRLDGQIVNRGLIGQN